MKFSEAAAELAAVYKREPNVEPEVFARTAAYRHFTEAAELDGLTGPNVEMDEEFASRSPKWVSGATEQELQRWVHTMLRADRCNSDYPDAVLSACRSGCVKALADRLTRHLSLKMVTF